jgi:exoribonuclease II
MNNNFIVSIESMIHVEFDHFLDVMGDILLLPNQLSDPCCSLVGGEIIKNQIIYIEVNQLGQVKQQVEVSVFHVRGFLLVLVHERLHLSRLGGS